MRKVKKGVNPVSIANLAKGNRFAKGQSGNPGGKPKSLAEVERLARDASPEAIARLRQIVRESESDAAAVSAANSLLDRGFGRPAQTVNVRKIKSLEDLDEDELLAIMGEDADGLGKRDGETEH